MSQVETGDKDAVVEARELADDSRFDIQPRARAMLHALADEVERLRSVCDVAMKGVGAPIMHSLAQEALRQPRTARPKNSTSTTKAEGAK